MSCSIYSENTSTERNNFMYTDIDIESMHNDLSGLKIRILNALKHRCSWIIFLISCNSVIVCYLWNWSISTNSLALKAYINTVVFNVCALAVCLISIWVEQNTLRESQRFAYSDGWERRRGKFVSELPRCKSKGKPPAHRQHRKQHRPQRQANSPRSPTSSTADDDAVAAIVKTDAAVVDLDVTTGLRSYQDSSSIFVLGFEKYEVLALLISSCFSLIVSFFIIIDAISRIKEQPIVHEGRLGLGAGLGLVAHIMTIVAYPDASLSHVVCQALPCPTLKGMNPILGGNLISFVILCGVHGVVHFLELHVVDTGATFAVIGLTVASMLPLAFYTTSIIFQKLSHHMSEQLNKCLREALVIDGVLEFRNEKFWTKSFGKLAGSLDVRIRDNADEHYVLANVVKRLSQVVSSLSVQEFRRPANNTAYDCYSVDELPLEYYVDELLLRAEEEKESEAEPKKRKDIADEMEKKAYEIEVSSEESVKIEEILNCAGSFLNHQAKRTSPGLAQHSYATLLLNEENCAHLGKSHLFRDVPVRNALILGSSYEINDLQCPLQFHCCS